jgi:hypothetical protein
MLARLTLLLVALPALALAADDSGVSGGRLKYARPAAAAASQATVQPASTPPTINAPPPITAPADPSACRMSCAQTYYFCRAGDQPDSCAGAWGQCVATCNSPNLANYSPAP